MSQCEWANQFTKRRNYGNIVETIGGQMYFAVGRYIWPSNLIPGKWITLQGDARRTMESQNKNQNYELKQKERNRLIQQVFQTYPVLAQLDERYDHILSKDIYFKRMEADEIMSSGENGCEDMIFIFQGLIKITKLTEAGDETNLYNIGKGEICHEYLNCMLLDQPLSIVGRVLQETLIAVIPFAIVQRYLIHNATFLTFMYQDLHKKLQYVIEAKEMKLHSSLEQRILTFLMKRKGSNVYVTHKEIALETDAAREAVSRKLKELEDKGYIRLGRGRIQICKDLSEFIIE